MKALGLLIVVLSCISAHWESSANLKDGIILKGYDAVSYFKNSAPQKGVPEIKTQIGGATYLFSSEANKAEFLKMPDKYTPAYEGWCATAVAKGKKVDIDPTNYKITDGRLFLFYRESGLFGGDAKPQWVKNETDNIKKADTNWPHVRELKD